MTDEAKPPKDEASEEAKRPGGPAAKKPAAKEPVARKPAAKKPAAKKPAAKRPAAAQPAASAPADAPPVAAAVAATAAGAGESAESTQVVPPDPGDAATQVVPPDDAPTRVIPEAPTKVMAAPGGPTAAPPAATAEPPAPPFAPVPQTIEDTGGGGNGSTLWLVLALAAVAVVAVLLVWAFALRDTGEQFAGDWAPADGGGGGLVVSLQDGDFTVTMYDEDLEVLGTYPATRDGDVLTYRFTDTQSGRGMMKATLTLDEDRDVLTLRLAAADAQGSAQEYIRVDALQAAVPPPTPTPTPTVTPTASPTASPTGSPSPSPSPTSTDPAVLDQQVVEGVSAINGAVVAWSAANGNVFPTAADVSPGGAVGQYLTDWPVNPFTGEPMSSGSEKGDYTYEQLNGGQGYRLTGHLSAGTFTMP